MKKYNPGNRIDDDFLILKASVERTGKGKEYVKFDVRDKDGTELENCKRWNCNSPMQGVVRIVGKADIYNEQIHIIADKWCRGTSSIDDFSLKPPWTLPSGENLYQELLKEMLSIGNQDMLAWLKKFLEHVRIRSFPGHETNEDPERIYSATGAISIHHGYQSGWVEHTLEVTQISKMLAIIYKNTLNLREIDLLIIGAVIHDVGKLYQFETVDGVYKYSKLCKVYGFNSNAEQLIGSHILLSYCLENNPPLNDWDNYFVLNNIICSHHGNQFSIAPAVYRISKLVHFADHISADMNRMSGNLKNKDEIDRDKVRESYLKVKEYEK